MVSPLQFKDNKVVTALADFTPQCDIRPELLLKLQGRLQTTLDLDVLLEIFFDVIQSAVAIDGVVYTRADLKKSHQVGVLGRHKIHYTLQTQKDEIGELIFSRSTRFREQELANIEGFLTALVYPLRNSLHYQQAIEASFKDPMTGVYNRASLPRTIMREIELSRRQKSSFAVAMLDIDFFKNINDTYGHSMGDKVIKDVVECIKQSIRQTDICFRYGGEEFLIAFSNTNVIDAWKVCERIRECISQQRFVFERETFKVTASIGFTHLHDVDTLESLIDRADQALYRAKNNGRDQVIGA